MVRCNKQGTPGSNPFLLREVRWVLLRAFKTNRANNFPSHLKDALSCLSTQVSQLWLESTLSWTEIPEMEFGALNGLANAQLTPRTRWVGNEKQCSSFDKGGTPQLKKNTQSGRDWKTQCTCKALVWNGIRTMIQVKGKERNNWGNT